MADGRFENQTFTAIVNHPNWGAIWGGTFTFVAIWSIFALLGVGIFASSANANAAHPVTGMNVGISVWLVILTIISMFVAGIVTGRLAAIGNAGSAVVHGIIMFGLSVVTAVVITVMATNGMVTAKAAAGTPHGPYLLTVFSDIGWVGFVALFLGWLAAMGGAASGVRRVGASIASQGAARQAA
jgi:hypothetical protein